MLGVLGAVITYSLWRPAGPIVGRHPGRTALVTAEAERSAGDAPARRRAPEPLRTQVLQGRTAVRDALIDFAEPERSFGASARDNAVRRADQCNAFLVRFDLAKLELPPKARVDEGDGELLRVGPEQQRQDEGVRLPAQDGVGRGDRDLARAGRGQVVAGWRGLRVRRRRGAGRPRRGRAARPGQRHRSIRRSSTSST